MFYYDDFFITDIVKTITTITMIKTTTYARVKPMAVNKNNGPKIHPIIGIAENITYSNHATIIAANDAAKNTRAAIIRIKKNNKNNKRIIRTTKE